MNPSSEENLIEDYERLRTAVWKWIIDANNCRGTDVGDLQWTLDRIGATCPEGLDSDD